jgi:hypothetical protein
MSRRAARIPEFMLSRETDKRGESDTLKYPKRLVPA